MPLVPENCERESTQSTFRSFTNYKGPLPVMKELFERITMDIVGPLPHSRRGNQYILVACNYAIRYPEAIPLHSIDAGTVAKYLIQLFFRVGISREILTDQCTNFMSQLLKELYNLLSVGPHHITHKLMAWLRDSKNSS